MQSIGFFVLLAAIMILIRAYKDQKKQNKMVKDANFNSFQFEYELECEFGRITSTEKQAVFNVKGMFVQVKVPFEDYGCWLSFHNDSNCVNFFFYTGFSEVALIGSELDTIKYLTEFLEDQNLIIR